MTKNFSESKAAFPAFVLKKRLGQNFLVDQKVLTRIAEACDLSPEETVLEIGPGQGALTRAILPFVKSVIAVEADRQLAEGLPFEFAGANIEVHHADFLKFDLSKVPGPIKAVGNLPYYISTPIITKVLENRGKFISLFMTVQLEFGERLLAKPRTKDYSSFTCFVNYFAEPKILFTIANKSFRPVPKVKSCFMRMDIRREPAVKVKDEAFFLNLIRQAFLQRRKSLLNSLGGFAPKDKLADVLKTAGVNTNARAEELGLEEYARIADLLKAQGTRSRAQEED